MTPTPPVPEIEELIAHWKGEAGSPTTNARYGWAMTRCAEELEAALPALERYAEVLAQHTEVLRQESNSRHIRIVELSDALTAEREARQEAERALEEAIRLVTLKDAHITDLSAQLTASEQALSAERARKVDLGLRLGQILGREYDGVPLDEVARRFVASNQSQKLWEYRHGLTADRLVEAEQSLASLRTALETLAMKWRAGAASQTDGYEQCDVFELERCADEVDALLAAPRTDETP